MPNRAAAVARSTGITRSPRFTELLWVTLPFDMAVDVEVDVEVDDDARPMLLALDPNAAVRATVLPEFVSKIPAASDFEA